MKESFFDRKNWRLIPVIVALLVLAVTTAVMVKDWRKIGVRDEDRPPVIGFSWMPLGEVDLKDFRGTLTMSDDYGLDFESYRMEIVEIGRTYDMPIPGMMGRIYEAPISLGLLADDPNLVGKSRLTIRFRIADDRGQETVEEWTVRILPPSVGETAAFTEEVRIGGEGTE